jgi:asparagine synthase (glutamine-hydrolysing)
MCGILGCINFKYDPKSLESIRHRGPDGHDATHFTVNGHQLTLAHRRLSIVDVSDNGKQPMQTADGGSCIVFNGEIYNHETLKPFIKEKDFRGHSDTETILNYFNENDIVKNLENLNGIFGFALLDQKNNKLYLTRDRFGVKPVYYYFENNQVVFSSEIRPFKYYTPMSYDKENVVEGLKMRYVGAPDTIYKKVKKVEPGQVIVFDLNNKDITASYHHYTKTQPTGTRKQEMASLTKEYGDLFVQAVERQLMSDVELGVLLSGGIDSALVAAVAKDKSSTPIKTFTVGFEEGLFKSDEIGNAKITAQTLGLENYETRVSFNDFIRDLKEIIQIVEEPIATNSIIPMYSLSRLVSKHVKVVLSGQGADEPLYGYRKYKGLLLLEPLQNNAFLRSGLKLSGARKSKKEDVRRLAGAAIEKDMFTSYREFNSITSRDEMLQLVQVNGGADVNTIYARKDELFRNKWSKRVPSEKAIVSFPYLDLRNSLADDLLMYSDKLMMNFGVECRVPILDNDLVVFIESIHHSYKFNFSKGKIIHKEFAMQYLPSSIINRKKIGFATPAAKWYDTYKQEIESIITESKEIKELFNIKTVLNLLNDHSKNQTREKQILILLSIALLTNQ